MREKEREVQHQLVPGRFAAQTVTTLVQGLVDSKNLHRKRIVGRNRCADWIVVSAINVSTPIPLTF